MANHESYNRYGGSRPGGNDGRHWTQNDEGNRSHRPMYGQHGTVSVSPTEGFNASGARLESLSSRGRIHGPISDERFFHTQQWNPYPLPMDGPNSPYLQQGFGQPYRPHVSPPMEGQIQAVNNTAGTSQPATSSFNLISQPHGARRPSQSSPPTHQQPAGGFHASPNPPYLPTPHAHQGTKTPGERSPMDLHSTNAPEYPINYDDSKDSTLARSLKSKERANKQKSDGKRLQGGATTTKVSDQPMIGSTPVSQQSLNPITTPSDSSLVKAMSNLEDQSQDDVKALLEKLFQYNAKDPGKVAKLFEEVKKSHAPSHIANQVAQVVSSANIDTTPQAMNRATMKTGSIESSVTTSLSYDADVTRSATSNDRVRGETVEGNGTPNLRARTPTPSQHQVDQDQSTSSTASLPSQQSVSKAHDAANTDTLSGNEHRRDISNSSTLLSSTNQPKLVWPESRRRIAASVVKNTLESAPENKGKKIPVDFINRVLGTSPTYDQLCLLLEAQGWKFNWGILAKNILKATNSGPSREAPAANSSRPLSSPQTGFGIRPAAYRKSPYAPSSQPHINSELASFQPPGLSQVPESGEQEKETLRSQEIQSFSLKTPSSQFFAPPVGPAASQKAIEAPIPNEEGLNKPLGAPASNVQGSSPSASQHLIPSPNSAKNKEEAARKRNFADIVDLTARDDDDEDEALELTQARKWQALDQPQNRFAENQQNTSLQNDGLKPANRFEWFKSKASAPTITSSRELLRNEMLVKPLDFSKASRRSTYDSRTIARDFLLANGTHTELRPLNWHMESFYSTFKHVKIDSDLATFRWDLVDPGEPVGIDRDKIPPKDVSDTAGQESQPQLHANHGNNVRKALRAQESESDEGENGAIPATSSSSKTVESPSTGNGTHVKGGRSMINPEISSQSHDIVVTIPSVGHKETAGGKTRVRDQGSGRTSRQVGRPSRGSRVARSSQPGRVQEASIPTTTPSTFGVAIATQAYGPRHPTELKSKNAVDVSASGAITPPVTGPSGNSTPRKGSVSVFVPASPGGGNMSLPLDKRGSPARTFSSGKRVGRPPGSKNKEAGNNIASPRVQSPSIRGDGSVAKKRGRPPGSRAGSFRSRGRGRVRGMSQQRSQYPIRTSMPDDGVGVLLPQVDTQNFPIHLPESQKMIRVYDSERLSRERDPRFGKDDSLHHHPPSAYPDTDRFTTFKCRWQGCISELHNLDTLRKHVDRIHLPVYRRKLNLFPERWIECLWQSCLDTSQDHNQDQEAEQKIHGLIMPSLSSLELHIEEMHMAPIAQTLGDGPNVKPRAVDPSVFLCDQKTGQVITPAAKQHGDGPPDPLLELHHENSAEFTRAYHKAHGNLTRASKARAQMYSRMALAADEDRLVAQGSRPATQWKQMNMSGLRVEVPLSKEALDRLGIPEGADVLDDWRDPESTDEAEAARLERKQRKRRFEYSETESESDTEDEEEEDEDGEELAGVRPPPPPLPGDDLVEDQPAMFTSPGRISMGIMAPSTLKVDSHVGDSDESDENEEMFDLPVRVNEP